MQWERPHRLFARLALTSEGWLDHALIDIRKDGRIASVTQCNTPPDNIETFDLILPGMSNVHSHAFQRAMAGLTETAGGKHDDNFWSWRQVMYLFKQKLTPPQVEIIARHLYIELLKQGYTSVGEFHYLHHDTNGAPYTNPAELSQRIINAAHDSGIHLTLLPVYYETSTFGGKPATEGQKRFIHTLDGYCALIKSLQAMQNDGVNLGIAPHSLRAVSDSSLKALLETLPSLGMAGCPIHIHISEQTKEVDECINWSGKRPVAWLCDNADIGDNWCLIHSTHANDTELAAIAQSNAVVGLCPTTEANLGDGIFQHEAFLKLGGRFGIGSDSNVCISPWEELKQMEYAQRLITRRRNVLCSDDTPSVGRTLYTHAASGGAQALGLQSGSIAPGMRADLIAIHTNSPLLTNKQKDQILDTLVFIAPSGSVSHVWVGGQCIISEGQHMLEVQSAQDYQRVMQEITC
jgi:formimidoylglutamate deiminase